MPTCFVAMGFGVKMAFYGGKTKPRALDLDKTYQNIIKPAAIAAGLDCVRADEIQHTTLIDKPMFERLLQADVVVADVSTANANAIYELGVRHALKPRTTVVLAEASFAFPFDINHLSILRYEHLGKDIGASEAKDKTEKLTALLKKALAQPETDSPVFIFLPQLEASRAIGAKVSSLGRTIAETVTGIVAAPFNNLLPNMGRGSDSSAKIGADGPQIQLQTEDRSDGAHRMSLAELRQAFEDALANAKAQANRPEKWSAVISKLDEWQVLEPNDPFVIQQLALATYKSEQPDKLAALGRAKNILSVLQPEISTDFETLGLWGAIHKRLWEERKNVGDLDVAIRSYTRGFFIRRNHYNGINLAFMLTLRAAQTTGDESIADRVLAARTRREVIEICDQELHEAEAAPEAYHPDDLFWLRASRAEALLGLGEDKAAQQAFEAAKKGPPQPQDWMIKSADRQMQNLRRLLDEPTRTR